jgi:hypothetical protein
MYELQLLALNFADAKMLALHGDIIQLQEFNIAIGKGI